MQGRKYKPEDLEAVRELSTGFTPSQIAKKTGLNRDQVCRRLRRMGIKAIHGGLVRNDVCSIPENALMELLEKFFGMPLYLESISQFSRDRIRKGVCFHMLKTYSPVTWDSLRSKYLTSELEIKEVVKYARKKAPVLFYFLTQKIENYDQRTQGIFDEVHYKHTSNEGVPEKCIGRHSTRTARKSA